MTDDKINTLLLLVQAMGDIGLRITQSIGAENEITLKHLAQSLEWLVLFAKDLISLRDENKKEKACE